MTERPDDVRLARRGDEELLYALIWGAQEECALAPKSDDKVRAIVRLAVEHEPVAAPDGSGLVLPPTIGVIEGPNGIEAAVGLYPCQWWYSTEWYLHQFLLYVMPDYRQSTHAKHLIEFAKWIGDRTGHKVLLHCMDPEHAARKMQLFERQAPMVGALYLHAAA